MIVDEPDRYPLLCLGIRILVGLFFIALGHLFKTKLERLNVYHFKFLLAAMTARIILYLNFKAPSYSFASADFDNLCVLFYSIIDIFFILYLSKVLGGLIKPGNFMYKIGNNTFHIMANHMLVFYILDCALIAMTGQDPAISSNAVWTYTWMGYLFLGIIIPTYFGMFLKVQRGKIELFLSSRFPEILHRCNKIAEYKIKFF